MQVSVPHTLVAPDTEHPEITNVRAVSKRTGYVTVQSIMSYSSSEVSTTNAFRAHAENDPTSGRIAPVDSQTAGDSGTWSFTVKGPTRTL